MIASASNQILYDHPNSNGAKSVWTSNASIAAPG